MVCPLGEDRFQIIAGERRYRAAKQLGWLKIPAVVRAAHAQSNTILALVENLQRSDLHVLEEAEAYAQLQREHGFSQGEIADLMGKSRSAVANVLRLLRLGDASRQALAAGEIEMGHARALLGVSDVTGQGECLQRVISGQWSVRRTENEVKKLFQTKNSHEEALGATRKAEGVWSPELGRYLGVEVILKGRQIQLRAKNPKQAKKVLESLNRLVKQVEESSP